jgi:hypothetical protein
MYPNARTGKSIVLIAQTLLLLLAAGIFSLHYLHLSADFPNHSPWMDWSKYTDEGWYGDAAIRLLERGRWYLPGDFNPAAALPVWPLLELAVFRITGVSLIAARALTVSVFACILIASFWLLRRTRATPETPYPLAPAVAVLLLAASPFCYAFTRIAILEPLLVLLTLLALLAATCAAPQKPPPPQANQTPAPPPRRLPDRFRAALPALALGLLIPLMVLTKTTAIFLLPAVAWMLWASTGFHLRSFLRAAVPAALLAALLWSAYFGLIVHPRFLADYRYLFSANGYTGITRENAVSVLADTFQDGLWMGKLLYPLGLLATLLALLSFRRLRRDPLLPALLLWIAGYLSFLAYHNNLQPRYYLVVAIPLTLLVSAAFEDLLLRLLASPRRRIPLASAALACAAVLLTLLVAQDLRQTLHYVRNPQYSFTRAAADLALIVAGDRTHSPLVLSISGSDLSLMTGLPSICDDFGTMELPDRIAAYHPGWYATWNEVDDDKMDALAPFYHLQRVAEFPAMDDPERNLLILYRLDPTNSQALPPKHRRPRQTLTGQHPTPTRLGHGNPIPKPPTHRLPPGQLPSQSLSQPPSQS